MIISICVALSYVSVKSDNKLKVSIQHSHLCHKEYTPLEVFEMREEKPHTPGMSLSIIFFLLTSSTQEKVIDPRI